MPASNRSSSIARSSVGRSRSSVRKAPSYDEAALEITTSPPLTSSLHSRNSASSAQESTYLKQAWWLRWTRLALTILIIGFGASILACTAHVLQSYNATHLSSHWHLPLWPATIDLKPTVGTLVPAAIAVATSFVYLIVAIVPSPHSRTLLLSIVFAIVASISILATMIAVIYSPVLIHHVDPNHRETLQSWTCKLHNGAKVFEAESKLLQLPTFQSFTAPEGYKRMCVESQVGQGLMIGLFCLEVLSVATAGVGFWIEHSINKVRKNRYTSEKWNTAS